MVVIQMEIVIQGRICLTSCRHLKCGRVQQRHFKSTTPYSEVCTWNTGWLLPWKSLCLQINNKKGSHLLCWSVLQMSKVTHNEYRQFNGGTWTHQLSQAWASGSFRAGQGWTILWWAASYGTGIKEHQHEVGPWRVSESENQADFFQPCIHISHKSRRKGGCSYKCCLSAVGYSTFKQEMYQPHH